MDTPRTFGRDWFRDRRDYPLRRIRTRRRRRYWPDDRWVGDQGSEPSCVGFAWAHWLVNAPILNYVDPSGIYRLAQQVDEWEGSDYDGTSVRAGAKVLAHLGFLEKYEFAWDLPTVRDTILELGPVVLGTAWLEGMMQPDPAGLIEATGEPLGEHAYLCTGYDARTKLFRIKNSWGRSWGLGGRAYLHEKDLAALLDRRGEACLAVELAVCAPHN